MSRKTVSLVIGEENYNKIKALCKKRNIYTSSFLRECINNVLNNEGLNIDITESINDKANKNFKSIEKKIRNSIISNNSEKMIGKLMLRENFSGDIRDYIEKLLIDRVVDGNSVKEDKNTIKAVNTVINQALKDLNVRYKLALNTSRYFRRALDELRDIAESGEGKCFERYNKIEAKALKSLDKYDELITTLYTDAKLNISGGKGNEQQYLIPSEQIQQRDK